MHRLSFLFGALVLLVLAVGCGGGQDVNLVIGQLGNTALPSAAGARGAVGNKVSAVVTHTAGDAIPSTSDFSYAVVDGIKIKLNRITFRQTNGEENGSDLGGQEVELGSGVSNVNLSTTVGIDPGSYNVVGLEMDESYQVKAFCRTDSRLVYTATDNTVKSIACSNALNATQADTTCQLPDDYGYKSYEFLNVSTAESPTSTSDQAQEETRMSFTVAEDVTANMAILVDTSLTVTCYDGEGAGSVDEQAGTLDPFAWGTSNGDIDDYFPPGSPNFGIGYLPAFSWVGAAGDNLPTAETYIAASGAGPLNADTLDFSALMVTTFIFDGNGVPQAARSRNFGAGLDMNQMYMDFVDNGDGTFQFDNGEWYTKKLSDPSDPGGPFADRRITDWQRLGLNDAPVSTTLTDGPLCGSTDLFYEDQTQPRAKACVAGNSNVFWKRFRRDDE